MEPLIVAPQPNISGLPINLSRFAILERDFDNFKGIAAARPQSDLDIQAAYFCTAELCDVSLNVLVCIFLVAGCEQAGRAF